MGRAALNWSVVDLALAASVAPNTVTRMELGRSVQPETVQRIRLAFEKLGLAFAATSKSLTVRCRRKP